MEQVFFNFFINFNKILYRRKQKNIRKAILSQVKRQKKVKRETIIMEKIIKSLEEIVGAFVKTRRGIN